MNMNISLSLCLTAKGRQEDDGEAAEDDATRNLPGTTGRSPATLDSPKGLNFDLKNSKINQTMLFQGVQLQKILDNSL